MEVPQLQCSYKDVDVPVVQVVVVPQVQFIDGHGRRRDHAVTWGSRTVETPQIQFIAGVTGHPSSHETGSGMAAMSFFLPFLGHFLRSVHPDVERQVSPR